MGIVLKLNHVNHITEKLPFLDYHNQELEQTNERIASLSVLFLMLCSKLMIGKIMQKTTSITLSRGHTCSTFIRNGTALLAKLISELSTHVHN